MGGFKREEIYVYIGLGLGLELRLGLGLGLGFRVRVRVRVRDICIHIADSLHCTVETNNIVKQLYSNLKKKQNTSLKST